MRRRDKNFESMIIMRHLRNFLIDNKITCRSLLHIPATKKGKVARTLSNKEYGIRWTSFSLQLIVLRIFVNDVAVGAKSLLSVTFPFLFVTCLLSPRLFLFFSGKKWWKKKQRGESNMQKKSKLQFQLTRFTNWKKELIHKCNYLRFIICYIKQKSNRPR